MAGCGDSTTLGMAWMMVGAKSATAVFVPCTGWSDIGSATWAKAMGEMRAKVNTVSATPCLQYANDPRSPLGTLAIGSTIAADGMLDPTTPTDITSLRSYRVARAGWLVAGDGTNNRGGGGERPRRAVRGPTPALTSVVPPSPTRPGRGQR